MEKKEKGVIQHLEGKLLWKEFRETEKMVPKQRRMCVTGLCYIFSHNEIIVEGQTTTSFYAVIFLQTNCITLYRKCRFVLFKWFNRLFSSCCSKRTIALAFSYIAARITAYQSPCSPFHFESFTQQLSLKPTSTLPR